ncbi:MAG: MBL fold metallo-hydrolase [Parcubacteria group bacterium]|nr:MBL fold metallo-hydrolase [Parcubacteria group bacterium]
MHGKVSLMILQRFGQSFFRLDTQGTVIAIDPFSKNPESGLERVPRFRADIVLVTHEHEDHNNVEALEGEPLVFRGPGEYAAKGIFIEGIASFHDREDGRERGANTIFAIESEGLRVVHMGDFGEANLREEQREKIGTVDILLIPVGGTYTIDGREAASLVHKIEPKAVIPMHYKPANSDQGIANKLEGPEKFLKELAAKPEPQDKLSIKAKELVEGKIQVFLLEKQ